MKIHQIRPSYATTVALLALALSAPAGLIADNFSAPHNYLSNGVGGTVWEGLTLGANPGNPVALTAWDANLTAANTLTITNRGGAWADATDGPFLWKLVNGDFTNTVRVSGHTNTGYNLAGILVRNPDTTGGQNWLYIGYFGRPEWGAVHIMRDTTAGISREIDKAPDYFDAANPATWPTWLQITRVGTMLNTSASTNGVDWELLYFADRPDLPEILQVGIFKCTYSADSSYAQFQNFKLEGPNVNAVAPPSPANGLTVTPAANSLNLSWTAGVGSAGSTVVMRKGPITRQPADGLTYTGSANFGSGSDLGETNLVVHNGPGNSVTVTNLVPSVTYQVVVYAYAGSGDNTVYALNGAPVSSGTPLGTLASIVLSFGATNAVAVDDTIQAKVTALFAGGGTLDVPASAMAFSSDKTEVARVATNGLISGLGAGTAAITARYQSVSVASNLTVIKLPVTDDFSGPRNYLTQGVVGTPWHGVLLGAGDMPASGSLGGSGPGSTLTADAGVTTPGRLTIRTTRTDWENADNDGFLLYRVIPGDFSISIQITALDPQAYHMAGLMARAPYEFSGAENYVSIYTFNQYNIGNYVRKVANNVTDNSPLLAYPAKPFIMLRREANTFRFYEKVHALESWTEVASTERPELEGVALQVGIMQGIFTGNSPIAEFANLQVSSPNLIPPGKPSPATNLTLSANGVGRVVANWTRSPDSAGSVVIAHPLVAGTRQPVDGVGYSNNAHADATLAQDLGGTNLLVYAGPGNSVSISNLAALPYHFAVYTYSHVGGSNLYTLATPATNSIYVLGLPTISAEPVPTISLYAGRTALLAADAVGTPPLNYQWQRGGVNVADGGNISGATTPSLTINTLATVNGGTYTLVVSNAAGSVTSAPVVLDVMLPTGKPAEASILSYNPVAYWRLDEPAGQTVAFDYWGGHDGSYGAAAVSGIPGPAPKDGFASFETGNTAVLIPGTPGDTNTPVILPTLNRTVSALTIACWIYPNSLPADRAGLVSFNSANTGLRLYPGTPNGLSILWNNTVNHSALVPPVGQWSFVAMTISPGAGALYLGNARGWTNFSDSVTRTPVLLNDLGFIGSDRQIGARYFDGLIDEVALFDTALSEADLKNLYTGTVRPPQVVLGIQRVGADVQLTWPQGILLESASVAGPWMTNTAASPYTVIAPQATKFYRVIVP